MESRVNELTGCEGLEFVAFSNVRIRNPVTLSKGVILIPFFLNENESEGRSIRDPLLLATMEMERHCRYVTIVGFQLLLGIRRMLAGQLGTLTKLSPYSVCQVVFSSGGQNMHRIWNPHGVIV